MQQTAKEFTGDPLPCPSKNGNEYYIIDLLDSESGAAYRVLVYMAAATLNLIEL